MVGGEAKNDKGGSLRLAFLRRVRSRARPAARAHESAARAAKKSHQAMDRASRPARGRTGGPAGRSQRGCDDERKKAQGTPHSKWGGAPFSLPLLPPTPARAPSRPRRGHLKVAKGAGRARRAIGRAGGGGRRAGKRGGRGGGSARLSSPDLMLGVAPVFSRCGARSCGKGCLALGDRCGSPCWQSGRLLFCLLTL